MADFCKACTEELFGVHAAQSNDMANITEPEEWDKGLAVTVLCEGCGPIQVDPKGNCVTTDCLQHGKGGHGLPWKAAAEPTCKSEES